MNVAIGNENKTAARGWYDAHSGLLQVEIDGVVSGLKFADIPDHDFESSAPVVGFSLGCEGAVVVCHHQDGAETWLPVDMWLPGGFNRTDDDQSRAQNRRELGNRLTPEAENRQIRQIRGSACPLTPDLRPRLLIPDI
jgi:hypothetical protein